MILCLVHILHTEKSVIAFEKKAFVQAAGRKNAL